MEEFKIDGLIFTVFNTIEDDILEIPGVLSAYDVFLEGDLDSKLGTILKYCNGYRILTEDLGAIKTDLKAAIKQLWLDCSELEDEPLDLEIAYRNWLNNV